MNKKQVILKKGKEIAVLRGHPWIFSGAIEKSETTVAGDWVEVINARGDYIASGHWANGSIAVRILSRTSEIPNLPFWIAKLQNCLQLRKNLGLVDGANNNAYRLVHGEGDGLSGLIIDIYHNTAVIQAHTEGMFQHMNLIADALKEVYQGTLTGIYNKSQAALHSTEATDGLLFGSALETITTENNLQFKVNWAEGQKTGFFLDQRENRKLLQCFAHSKSVLNTFSYTGGFSVYALQGQANQVVSVDVSSKAIALANENVELNFANETRHTGIVADVMPYLKTCDSHDIVIVDPPAFAKNNIKKHNAVMGYKRLNALAMQKVKPGGMLFTFSCSQVIDTDLFTNTITAAGLECGRNARIIHRLTQGPDHPVNLYHPEGNYLKGLVLQMD